MNIADAAVLAVAVISALIGFTRGFIREVFGLGAWIGAIVLAIYFAYLVRPPILKWTGDPQLADPLSYVAIFLPALVVLSMITGTIGNAVRGTMLGSLDRTMGLAFGVARAALLVAAAYIVLGWLLAPTTWPEPVKEARSTPYAYTLAVWLVHFLPEQYRPNVVPPESHQTKAADLLQPSPRGRATARP